MKKVTRREFIKISAVGGTATVLTSGLTTKWWGLDRDPVLNPHTDGEKVVPTFCELCFWKCGVLAHVKDGRVTKLVGNPAHPLSRGKLCPRGVGGTGLLYDPDRLKKPLIRGKKRGEDVFQEVDWNTALDKVAYELKALKDRHGPEALALFNHGFGGSWFTHLLKMYGSKNIGAPSYAQCRGPREAAFLLTFGSTPGSPENLDIRNARCLTLIGSHLGENMHNTQVQELADAIDSGAQLVVIDPRFSTAAGKARYWLPIKPGTDIALLLAWMNVIISEKRYDADYIARHAVGFEELKAHVADKTPEWAYPITGINADLIRETARFISSFKPASLIHPGRRVTWTGDDTQRVRASAILSALLGAWGRRGGFLNVGKMSLPTYPVPDPEIKARPAVDKPKGGGFPFADETLASGLCDATMPGTGDYDIKAWMVYGTNLIQSLPNPKRTIELIQNLEFLVSIDVLPAEICGWSDVVLPEATYLERDDDLYAATYKEPFIAIRQKAVEPLYDSKPGWWIAKQLGIRLGLEKYFPWNDAEDVIATRLKAGGYDLAEIKKTGVLLGTPKPTCEEEGWEIGFGTSSGKIELFSGDLKAEGFHPMPEFTAPEEAPAGMFKLLTGRASAHTFGRTANNRVLKEAFPENELWINTDVAQNFGDGPLKSGDRVVLVNQDGVRSTPIRVKVTQRIRGDCVYMVHGWGHTAQGLKYAHDRGASSSELTTRYKVDPIMGGTGTMVNFVKLERAKG